MINNLYDTWDNHDWRKYNKKVEYRFRNSNIKDIVDIVVTWQNDSSVNIDVKKNKTILAYSTIEPFFNGDNEAENAIRIVYFSNVSENNTIICKRYRLLMMQKINMIASEFNVFNKIVVSSNINTMDFYRLFGFQFIDTNTRNRYQDVLEMIRQRSTFIKREID